MDERPVVRYPTLKGTLLEKKHQMENQLSQFRIDAKAGKVISLSSLIGNAEELHLEVYETKHGKVGS